MRVAARELNFDVRTGGPEDGPPVLLLHGFPQHGGMWDAVVPALHAAGLRTYAPDQRGYSPGARPSDVDTYRMGEFALDAVAMLDALGIGQVHVVGHDWGSVVGWHLAVDHAERVATLTAVSVPHPVAVDEALAADDDQRRRSAYIRLFRIEGKAEQVLLEDGARRLRGLFAGSGLGPQRLEAYVAPLLEPGALTGALNWYRRLERSRLGPARRPVTFVWGDGDLAVGRTAALGCADHVVADYRFVPLEGVSHWIADEVPEILASEILARIGADR
jgi:pimeloyl-ACP methyl ester carboxylesterase